jgi:superfamily II DNA or RNA helicase
VEKHGKPLYDLLRHGIDDRPIFYVSGKVGKEDREYIRTIVNQQEQSIVVASEGTFSEGVNIPNLDNLVFASPSKSRIQTMQKIGRGLRRTKNKSTCNLYDIADDLTSTKNLKTLAPKNFNHTLRHYLARIKYYTEEKFSFDQTRIELYDLYPEKDFE